MQSDASDHQKFSVSDDQLWPSILFERLQSSDDQIGSKATDEILCLGRLAVFGGFLSVPRHSAGTERGRRHMHFHSLLMSQHQMLTYSVLKAYWPASNMFLDEVQAGLVDQEILCLVHKREHSGWGCWQGNSMHYHTASTHSIIPIFHFTTSQWF